MGLQQKCFLKKGPVLKQKKDMSRSICAPKKEDLKTDTTQTISPLPLDQDQNEKAKHTLSGTALQNAPSFSYGLITVKVVNNKNQGGSRWWRVVGINQGQWRSIFTLIC